MKMYVVTNRELDEQEQSLKAFKKTLNHEGPNELRLVEVTKKGSKHQVGVIDDRLQPQVVAKIASDHNLDLDPNGVWFASLKVAAELFALARKTKKQVLIYVHGYNNDVGDVIRTAEALQQLYDVIVVPFTWPANGGGKLSGTAAYLSDKQDGRASADALNRFIGKVAFYHQLLTEGIRSRLLKAAAAKFPDNPVAAQEDFTRRADAECKTTLNLLCHSMGAYVLKHALRPGGTGSRGLVFDNVVLAAPDTNNEAHADWLERIQVRRRVYVVINENDYALAWSRRKPGEEQLPRLGHYLKGLNSENAYYIDVTEAPLVGNAHGYFTGKVVQDTKGGSRRRLRMVFEKAFEGGRAEEKLTFRADLNVYECR